MRTAELLRDLKRLRIERDLTFEALAAQIDIAPSRLYVLLNDPEAARLQERTKHRLEQWLSKHGGK